jgi:hypothetical protein
MRPIVTRTVGADAGAGACSGSASTRAVTGRRGTKPEAAGSASRPWGDPGCAGSAGESDLDRLVRPRSRRRMAGRSTGAGGRSVSGSTGVGAGVSCTGASARGAVDGLAGARGVSWALQASSSGTGSVRSGRIVDGRTDPAAGGSLWPVLAGGDAAGPTRRAPRHVLAYGSGAGAPSSGGALCASTLGSWICCSAAASGAPGDVRDRPPTPIPCGSKRDARRGRTAGVLFRLFSTRWSR